jgi:hypothetical protein
MILGGCLSVTILESLRGAYLRPVTGKMENVCFWEGIKNHRCGRSSVAVQHTIRVWMNGYNRRRRDDVPSRFNLFNDSW